jgi:hypothetical protein
MKRSASSSSLSPSPASTKKGQVSKRSKKEDFVIAADEFQQITLPSFVDHYRVDGLGYGGDVYYQPEVRLDIVYVSNCSVTKHSS